MTGREPVITEIRTHVVDTGQGRTFLFVVIDTDAGVTGVGEGSQSDQDGAVVANVRALAPAYVGQSPFELVERRGRVLTSFRTGRAYSVAVSALEQALWDVMGKLLDVPVYRLLGGSVRDQVDCYATMAVGLPDWTAETFADEAARCVGLGLRGVKVAPFIGADPHALGGRMVAHGTHVVAAVREAIGPEPEVLFEASFSMQRANALALAHELAPYRCLWLEAPFEWDDPARLASLRNELPIRLASGETSHGRFAYRDLIERQAVDVLQPDVKWTGGILEAKKIAAWAEAYQLEIALHNNSGPVATAASAHLSLTLPNALALEVPSRAPAWEEDLVRGTSAVEEGVVRADRLAGRPGLGIDFDEAVAAAHAAR